MLIYLASPYSHPDRSIQDTRVKQICQIAADLLSQGNKVFSPIAHGYSIATMGEYPEDWKRWKLLDEELIRLCREMWIATLPGWESSYGIAQEVKIASQYNKPIYLLTPENFAYEGSISSIEPLDNIRRLLAFTR